MMRRFVLILCLAVGLAGCDFMTDAATRIAYDLEREAAALRRSGEATRTFTHKPKASPEGRAGAAQEGEPPSAFGMTRGGAAGATLTW